MANHFSVIGFKANSTEALSALVNSLLEKGGEKQPCAAGYYHRLRSAVGAELWVHMQKAADAEPDPYIAVGITPFFEGEGRAPIRVRAMRQRPDDNHFEGAFYVELGPTIALIDVVDFARFAGNARALHGYGANRGVPPRACGVRERGAPSRRPRPTRR